MRARPLGHAIDIGTGKNADIGTKTGKTAIKWQFRVVNLQGDVYCKYVPTSFHVVHDAKLSSGEVINGDRNEVNLFKSLPKSMSSRKFVHD